MDNKIKETVTKTSHEKQMERFDEINAFTEEQLIKFAETQKKAEEALKSVIREEIINLR